ncbi:MULTISPECIES: UDP-N-acetylglucosamine--N-acetylmuramyl-(pentapeptide) pyrophosphoryl-undecaprenol N-acetylglucosamine transferase [unclassified Microbacterium]|uniref:UDP-N-acetylglucosamine--N-acetylmuramyl- (pentapeptide) pyrophosphoryl-undecaprenol N-acetylglucosamine transferase n=1 Tax=unclassified Microbacterium TaxID=2609290 RepID=UPI0024687C05|nr:MULTISPECIES: UDP-N-acetylglucosamine--N-acetylmuramyl-(pentapeptide) pyrophosphoryl-undecaprenol N-acetylglucosamine transferase [unclassified Microbacterium]MDH5131490.1 UDP-N-acetylglucosamine--N-acetylmuramyl-(pentapeptide) pyrophosphoryl-undecaprenol N-acetylglucosamine transferase [Microbacterium sp. RD10]MDH5135231.1 UDP-N-acetylglucosamine--N-acetylmuramyl-(pentapeptide) pyrophosphoryl-undecaprenol N-acetylglucosamine transferase [Microbacterium sp. RD11]MDH5143541.1 UDP-N-acetylgluco
MTSYLLAGGGTAGHVNPLLAVADALRERDPSATILVLGTAEGLESRLVPERGYELLIVDKVPFPRRPNAQAAAFPARFRRAIAQVRAHIRQHGIDIVVGFGGYASAPAYVAARRERVPFVVHEANAKPGLANVLGARAAAGVGVAFAGTPLRGSEVVGMPLRREVITLDRAARRAEAAEYFGLAADRPVLLVFGGSLGAQRLNDALADSWRDILAAGWQLLHVTGERSDLPDPGVPGYALRRYIDRMDLAFALADLIVSRSGSATVSEISALGIPALYVPYSVGNGEQRLNAGSAVAAGAAQLLDDATFDGDAVRRIVVPLLGDRDRIRRMAEAAETAGTRTGTENVVAMIDRALGAA